MIYINKNNQQLGPFDDQTAGEMLLDGRLAPNDLACRHGATKWATLVSVLSNDEVRSSDIVNREFDLYDIYSGEMTAILDQLIEAEDRQAKELRRQFEQKLQIAQKHINSIRQQFPDAFEIKAMDADVLFLMARYKLNQQGFFNKASGHLLDRGKRKRSLTSLTFAAATRMVANQQERKNAGDAINLLNQSINIFDTAGARLFKANILNFLGQKTEAVQELNYIITNFQSDDAYLPARQLKDEIENPAKKGACFVATATYGSPLAPEVETFRQFRDKFLLKSKSGEKFVNIYYHLSPPIAAKISSRNSLKKIVRTFLLSPLLQLIRFTKLDQ